MFVNYIKENHRISVYRSCKLMDLSCASYYRKRQRHSLEDREIIEALRQLASRHKRWGCDKMIAYLKNAGKSWNHKRIRRIYKESGLNIRIKPKRHFKKTQPEYLFQPVFRNVCWSMDFMTDALIGGIKFRVLNVIDDYNRKAIGIASAFSMPATFVTRQLEQWCYIHGYPEMMRTDNGPEFISKHFQDWAATHNIQLRTIQPGKPAQNGFIERFNKTFRQDILDANHFYSLQEVQYSSNAWLVEYNTIRPHEALGNLAPDIFEAKRQEYFVKNLSKQSQIFQF